MENVKEVAAISSSEAQPEESGKGVKRYFRFIRCFHCQSKGLSTPHMIADKPLHSARKKSSGGCCLGANE